MGKLVILKIGEGSFEQGFPVTLQIGDENARPSIEITGQLHADAVKDKVVLIGALLSLLVLKFLKRVEKGE